LLTKKDLNEVMLFRKPLTSPIGKLKSVKLLQFDLATLDTRDLYDYLGTESYQDMPQVITYPSDLQSRLLFYFSDITEDISRADSSSQFTDFSKFFKKELVSFLGQVFKYLVNSSKEILKEEDFLRIMFDKEKVVKPQIEQRKL
jgi:hypothetical protein